ncbi:MAG: glycosyltransferase family 2 protein [candidate division WWE3 bacterium]|nr:glycosyltransferase family 2 protein [candidate division WWE3 bacterium]
MQPKVSAGGRPAFGEPSNRNNFVSAVVPVYNEQKTVAKVVRTLLKSPRIAEVIVVNDGSTDNSRAILRKFGDRIRFLDFRRNRGKGFALAIGIKKAHGEIVTFWDADLLNLSEKHIQSLTEPILSKEAEIVLGHRALSPFKNITGQRAYYRRDLLPHLGRMAKTRFGVEVYLNDALKDLKLVQIPWRDLETLLKYQKFDSKTALQEYLKAGTEIAQTITRREITKLNQDWKVLKKVSKIKSLTELRKTAEEIESPQIRKILNDYVLKYIAPKTSRKR